MKGLQPGSYFNGDSLEIPAAAAAIAADYLPSGLMCLPRAKPDASSISECVSTAAKT